MQPRTDPHRIETLAQLRELIGEPVKPLPVELLVRLALDRMAREFIEASPFLLLASADAEGRLYISPKEDPAGFVLIEDDTTLVTPGRVGNKLAFGH